MKKLLSFLFFIFFVAGCEVLEEDISHKQVPVVAPVDGVSVVAGNVDFRWAAVQYASGYELTVVSPSFSAAGRVVADTVIRADTLDRRFGCRVALTEGEYEWSVAGFNGGYRTRTGIRRLTVLPAETPDAPDTPDAAATQGNAAVGENPDARDAAAILGNAGAGASPGSPGYCGNSVGSGMSRSLSSPGV